MMCYGHPISQPMWPQWLCKWHQLIGKMGSVSKKSWISGDFRADFGQAFTRCFYSHGGGSRNGDTPIAGWFRMEHPLRMDDLGVPPFQEMPIYYTGLSENRGMPSSNLVGGAITILKNMSSSMVSDDIPYTVYIYIIYEMENNPAMLKPPTSNGLSYVIMIVPMNMAMPVMYPICRHTHLVSEPLAASSTISTGCKCGKPW